MSTNKELQSSHTLEIATFRPRHHFPAETSQQQEGLFMLPRDSLQNLEQNSISLLQVKKQKLVEVKQFTPKRHEQF